jgi:AraC family transcriptional regulator, transcriptional activator of the genes for pyochelin and ferripyochelin receptors
MNVINYRDLLENAQPNQVAALSDADAPDVYQDKNNLVFRSRTGATSLYREVMRIGDDALLLASDCRGGLDATAGQVIDDSDWIHIQIRLDGGGYEHLPDAGTVATPHRSCIVARYPKDCVIERRIIADSRRRFVCLFMRPKELTGLLDIASTDLPERAAWLGMEGQQDLRASVLPLVAPLSHPANDVLSCSYAGVARRGFMRAKAIEIIAAVVKELQSQAPDERPDQRLSSQDRAKIAIAYSLLHDEEGIPWTIGGLARRVGLNRSKLSEGFRQVYGAPIRKYWRDTNLDRARSLLESGEVSVTEVALSMGYSDAYSFTRAFMRRFGVLPSACKA